MKIAVCDDEKMFRDTISAYLKPFIENSPEITQTAFSCGEDLIAAYEQGNRFDLIFLDVEMAGMSGVEAGRRIRAIDTTVMFVFITSHTKYVPEAFILSAFQFLVKPVEREMFDKEFDRAMRTYKKIKYRYSFTYRGKITVLEVKDVIYIETYNRHLRVTSTNGSFEYLGNIAIEEKKLADFGFLRCHKCYLVNMHYIFRPENYMFELTNHDKIPISKHGRSEVMAVYNKYVSGCSI